MTNLIYSLSTNPCSSTRFWKVLGAGHALWQEMERWNFVAQWSYLNANIHARSFTLLKIQNVICTSKKQKVRLTSFHVFRFQSVQFLHLIFLTHITLR